MNHARLMNILLSPRVSDKAYRLGDESNYVAFKVITDAKKYEIKAAVEHLFDVTVEAVRTMNVKGKSRRFGRVQGKTKAWKKAYVKLKQGDEIHFGTTE